ncbi:MAG: hypothetical protein GDA47_01250 [Rhodospirillales bacterium]|nr:hypothetical protein [Rhodospirillales bacterium]
MSDLRLARLAVPKSLLPAVDEVAIFVGATIWADLEGDPDPVVLELTLSPELDAALKTGLAALFEAFGQPLPALTPEILPERTGWPRCIAACRRFPLAASTSMAGRSPTRRHRT